MLAEIRTKSQITIPKAIITSLGLNEGDKLDIIEKDGAIIMIPVTVYPKKYVDALKSELLSLKEQIALGQKKVYANADELLAELESDSKCCKSHILIDSRSTTKI